jgi:alpha-beta hydrolase superfamily lysophospholipase
VVKAYLNDPLVHDRISVSLIDGAFNTASEALGEASSLKKPVLIMHGSDDKICSPAGSAEFASKTGMAQLKIWEGGFHELHNDLNKSEVVDYTINWINSRLS